LAAAAVCGLPLTGCALAPARWWTLALERVRLDRDGLDFEQVPSGRRFVPWGFNYTRGDRLLEDFWESEWPEIVADFREMRTLGANVVRVHLQLGRFLRDPATPDAGALDRLERLAGLAQETGLYLDVTGLGAYRAADVPAWYFALDEDARWAVHATFWEAVAARLAASPAVFCYDLMNEPVVPVGRLEPDALLDGEFGGYHFIQRISLDQAGRPREEIARAWVRRLTEAIRRHDAHHLITLGALPPAPGWGHLSGFAPELLAAELDFVSVHVYPEEGKVAEGVDVVRSFALGPPLVIEETYLLSAQPESFEAFFRQVGDAAAGWLGFYTGRAPEDVAEPADVRQALEKAWLELFLRLRPAGVE
jgi:Cellulase (glycosyl hydrolase family 5)